MSLWRTDKPKHSDGWIYCKIRTTIGDPIAEVVRVDKIDEHSLWEPCGDDTGWTVDVILKWFPCSVLENVMDKGDFSE